MGNETSSPSKRSSGKRKDQKPKPKVGKQSLSGLSVIEEVSTCDDIATKGTVNVHSNGEPTEIIDINMQLKKPPETNGEMKNEENKDTSTNNDNSVTVNNDEQSKQGIHKLSETATDNETTTSESRGKPTLKELATNQVNGQRVNNETEQLSDNAAAEIRLELLKQEVTEETTTDTSVSPATGNDSSQTGKDEDKSQKKSSGKPEEELQTSKQASDSNDYSVKLRNKGDENKKYKSNKKNKKQSSKKSSGHQEPVSYDTKPESSVSSAHSSESVSISMASDLEHSTTSIDISNNVMHQSSSSIDITESGKKGKQKLKKSPSKSSSGSNDSKEKKKKKKKPSGIGNKNLPKDNNSPIEKRRSIFDEEIIIDTSLVCDNLEVVSLSSLSSDGDEEETDDVSTLNISTIDSSPDVLENMHVPTKTSETDGVSYPRNRNYPYSIQELSVQDVSPTTDSSSLAQRTFFTFQYNRKINPYIRSNGSGLILRQNSDISYGAGEKRKPILTRPLSFEGATSKSWIVKHNSFSDILKRSTAVLSPRYRRHEDKAEVKSMDPQTSIVYI